MYCSEMEKGICQTCSILVWKSYFCLVLLAVCFVNGERVIIAVPTCLL